MFPLSALKVITTASEDVGKTGLTVITCASRVTAVTSSRKVNI
jgi:hypothetical protein